MSKDESSDEGNGEGGDEGGNDGAPALGWSAQALVAFMLFGLEYGIVKVAVRVKAPDVVLPDFFTSPYLILDYGLSLSIPIDDLVVDERGISATLSFHRTPFKTFVPWRAVTSMAMPPEAIDTPEKQNKLRGILEGLPSLAPDGPEAEAGMKASDSRRMDPILCAVPSDAPFDPEAQDEETAATAVQMGGRAGLSIVR